MGFNNINLQVSGPVQPTATYKTKVLKGQVPFAVQVTEPNTKYVIKHNFVLNGDVTIPENCILEFDGGSIANADGNSYTISIGNSQRVVAGKYDYIFKNINVINTGNKAFECYICWFGVLPQNEFNNDYFANALGTGRRRIIVPSGNYHFTDLTMHAQLAYSELIGDIYQEVAAPVTFTIGRENESDRLNTIIFDLSIYYSTIKGIAFAGTEGTMRYICLNLKDGILGGQVDSHIIDCSFNYFYNSITINGRGAYIENNLFRVCENAISYYPAIQAHPDEPSENYPYDGRAIKIHNNRGHVIKSFFFRAYNNTDYLGALFGFQLTNNLIDGSGILCQSDIFMHDSIISGNVVLKPSDTLPYNHIAILKGCAKTHIINNILTWDLEPDQNIQTCVYIKSTDLDNFPIKDIIILGNTFGKTSRNAIALESTNTQKEISSIIIKDNISDTEREFIQIIGCKIVNSVIIDNTITDTSKKIIVCNNAQIIKSKFEFLPNDTYTSSSYYENVPILYHSVRYRVGNDNKPDLKNNMNIGLFCFDVQANNGKGGPIWYKGINNNTDIWISADGIGTDVKRNGTKNERPIGSSIYVGFQYMQVDTNNGTFPIWASAISGDTVTWVDATGATV